jgi:hypothetical protein
LAGSDNYIVTGTDTGTSTRVSGGWSEVENLAGTTGADTFTFNAGSALTGNAGGLDGADTFTLAGNASAANLFGNEAADTFNLAGFTLTGTIFGGTSAGNGTDSDTLAGGTTYVVTGAGDGTSPNVTGGWNRMENLTGTAGADTFTFNPGTTLTGTASGLAGNDTFTTEGGNAGATITIGEMKGDADNDTFNLRGSTVATAVATTITGGTGNDTLNFGVPNTLAGTARLQGSVDLGIVADSDTLDFSGTSVGLTESLISGTFAGVNNLIGNGGSQLIGQNLNTFWRITGTNSGEFASNLNDLGTVGATIFTNFSVQAGSADDTFFFTSTGHMTGSAAGGAQVVRTSGGGEQSGTILFVVGAGAAGIDGGGGVNTLVGSPGDDNLTITGPSGVNITVNGTTTFNSTNPTTYAGGNTTILLNIATIDSAFDVSGSNVVPDTGNDVFNFGLNRFTGNINGGGGRDAINIDGGVTASISAVAASGMTASAGGTFAGGFNQIEVLNTGSGADTITLTVAPTDVTNTTALDMGAGTDSLTSNVAADWLITGAGTGFVRDPGTPAQRVAFSGVDNLSSTVSAVLTLPTAGPGGSISGTFTAPTVALTPGNAFAGADGLRIVAANGVSSGGALNLDSDGEINIQGSLTVTGNLNLDSVGSTVVTGAVSSTGNIGINSGAGIGLNSTVSSGGGVTINSTGNVAVGGALTAPSGLSSTVNGGTATYSSVDTTNGAQTYNGLTTLTGNVFGGTLTFNGQTTISGQVEMRSSTNIFNFAAPVVSSLGTVLSIVPTPTNDEGVDLFIDLAGAGTPGHISSDKFSGFLGTLAIGGKYTPDPENPDDTFAGTISSATADHILVSENFRTGGDLLLIGSAIQFTSGTEVAAGPAGGNGDIALLALGNSVQANNNGLAGSDDGAELGNIDGPDAFPEVTLTGGRAFFGAQNAVNNSRNIIMNLGGGTVAVAQSAAADALNFSVLSNATASTTDATATLRQLLGGIAGFDVDSFVGDLANIRLTFVTGAATLAILQNLSFVDASLFEEDLSLFGQIGDGIAKSLDQCEEAEGCAPNVTEEELAALIEKLNERISRLEALLESGEISAAEAQPLLDGYRTELQEFLSYQTQLAEYNASQEEGDFGDDAGDEFEDVFEAEEVFEEPAADEDAPLEEDAPEEVLDLEEAEEPFAPVDEAVEDAAPAEEAAPADEDFEELDEAVDAVETEAAPAETPAEPEDSGEPAFDEGEFEELEEEFDDVLMNLLLKSDRINQIAGVATVGRNGGVVWTGDVVLPALYRRY